MSLHSWRVRRCCITKHFCIGTHLLPSSCLSWTALHCCCTVQILSLLFADLQKHPTAAEAALQLIAADYDSAPPRARSGSALAVKACASHFDGDMLMTALHFLLEHGLADVAHVQEQKATVSEQMMQAGKAACLCGVCSVCHMPACLLTDSQLLT